ncbi:MAG: SGNH/GDSL hydrolase family protein [Candidatus Omnitrophica bacterium]|nr:SGNH/GDSL hydrolase family protein [Candidatus Omnitrophota bacterium]
MKLKLILKKGRKNIKISLPAVVLMLCFGIVGGFLVAEFMVRKTIVFPLDREYGKFLHLSGFSIPKANVDEKLFWKSSPEFRGVPHSIEKKKRVFRVVCLGDSVTQSHGADGYPLPLENTYVFYLEKILESSFETMDFEAINAGVGGYSSLQGVRYLQNKLIKYGPDLVVVWFGVNDDSDALFFPDKDQRIGKKIISGKNKLLENSKFYLFLKNVIFKPRLRRVSKKNYYENCREMLLLGADNNCEAVFVVPVEIENGRIEYYAEYKEALERLKIDYNCAIIDIRDRLNADSRISEFFIDNCHATAEGNRLIAEAIVEELRQKGIIKEKD